jgi:hypothetical protein
VDKDDVYLGLLSEYLGLLGGKPDVYDEAEEDDDDE